MLYVNQLCVELVLYSDSSSPLDLSLNGSRVDTNGLLSQTWRN